MQLVDSSLGFLKLHSMLHKHSMLLLSLPSVLSEKVRLVKLSFLLLADNRRDLVELIEEAVTGSCISAVKERRVVFVESGPIVGSSVSCQTLEVVSVLVPQGAEGGVVGYRVRAN